MAVWPRTRNLLVSGSSHGAPERRPRPPPPQRLRRCRRRTDHSSERAHAASLVISQHSVICDRTAAWIWGVDCFSGASSTSHLPWSRAPSAATARPTRSGIRGGQRDLMPSDWCGRRRRPRHHSRCARRSTSAAAFPSRCPGCDGRPGACPDSVHRAARACLPAVLPAPRASSSCVSWSHWPTPRAESQGESWTRIEMHDQGLPRPELNGGSPSMACRSSGSTSRTPMRKRRHRVRRRGVPLVGGGQASRRRASGWLERHGWIVIVVDKNSFTDEALALWSEDDPYRTRGRPTPAAALVRAVVSATHRTEAQLNASRARNSTHHRGATRAS